MKFLMQPLHAREWTYLFVSTVIIWTTVIFSFNYLIDPFGSRDWIIEKKFKPIIHERSEKYNLIFNQNNFQKYDCIILGSSRVMSMVPLYNQATKGCYNFGVHVANNPEKLFLLQEWIKRAPLKKVYLGNELYNMHPFLHPLELNPSRFTHGSEGNYLSISTLQISFKVLKNFLFNIPQVYFESDGSIRFAPDEKAIKSGQFDHSYSHFKQISHNAVQGNFIYNSFTYESKALTSLQDIKTLCNKHHIKLYSFITPTFYEAQLTMQSYPELNNASIRFRQDLTNIFDTIYDFDINNTENQIPSNFYDPVHYRPIIGNLMINQMEDNGTYGVVLHKNLLPTIR